MKRGIFFLIISSMVTVAYADDMSTTAAAPTSMSEKVDAAPAPVVAAPAPDAAPAPEAAAPVAPPPPTSHIVVGKDILAASPLASL